MIEKKFEEYCRNGNIDEIKKIIDKDEFKNHSSLSYIYSSGVYQAVDYNKLNVVKFLLEDSNLKNKISINFENNCILKTACRQNYFEIINYLILEYKMQIDKNLMIPNYENCTYVAELYTKRIFYNSISFKLEEKKEIKHKSKKI